MSRENKKQVREVTTGGVTSVPTAPDKPQVTRLEVTEVTNLEGFGKSAWESRLYVLERTRW